MLGRPLASLALSLLLAACNAGGDLSVARPKIGPVRPSSVVALNVDALTEAGAPADRAAGIEQVRRELYLVLPSSGLFKQVVQTSEPSDYRMDVHLRQVRQVSGSARFWLGFMAGRSELVGDVVVLDHRNGIELTAFRASGQSAAQPISPDDGFEDAVRLFGEKVVEALRAPMTENVSLN